MKVITCTNEAGDVIAFPAGFVNSSSFVLEDATGVLEAKADLFTSDGALSDGVVYQGARMQKRNIVLTVRDKPGADHAANRAALFTLFRFRQPGVLVFADGATERLIEYVTESVTANIKSHSHSYQISLLCPSPFWQSAALNSRVLGGTVSGFSFPHVFLFGGEAFSTRETALAFEMNNPGAANEIGLTIQLAAINGAVTNPRVYRLESGGRFCLGDTANPLVIAAGDAITITTGRGRKRVLNSSGESLAGYLSEDSEFLTIMSGANTFSVSAERGQSNLKATFSWRFFYEGA